MRGNWFQSCLHSFDVYIGGGNSPAGLDQKSRRKKCGFCPQGALSREASSVGSAMVVQAGAVLHGTLKLGPAISTSGGKGSRFFAFCLHKWTAY